MFTLFPFGFFRPKVNAYLVDSDTGKPLDPNVSEAPSSSRTDVRRDKNGKMVMIRHKNKPASSANGEAVKDASGKKGGKANGDGKKVTQNDDDLTKPWTADDDAKLKELKEQTKKTWAEIGEELGRPKHEVSDRYRQIKDDAPAATNDKKGDKQEKGGKGGKNQDAKIQDDKDGDFTAEEKEKMKELLASNTNFKDIAKQLNKTLNPALKACLGKLKAEGGDSGDKGAKGGDGQKKQEDGGKKSKNKGGDGGGKKEEKSNDEGKKNNEDKEKKPAKAASNAPSHRSEAKFTMREWMTLQEDDLFSFGELQLLAEIVANKKENFTWLGVASEFMDQTGRRVHPEDIREKFEQMGDMAK